MVRLCWPDARRELTRRLSEPAPGPVQLLTGPCRSGKTTLLRVAAEPFADTVVHARGDGISRRTVPPLADAWRLAEQAAARDRRALLVVDDIHFVKGWEAWMGGAWTRLRASRLPLHVAASATCALEPSLAARPCEWLEPIALRRWTASAMVKHAGLEALAATDHVVCKGAHPPGADAGIAAPALEQDLPAVAPVRRPALLRGVFDACVASAARVASLVELREMSGHAASLDLVFRYLRLLEAGGLVAALPEFGDGRWSAGNAAFRLVLRDNALLPAGAEVAWERRVRNACLAHACESGRVPRFWRDGPLEVDAITDNGRRRQLLVIRLGPVEEEALAGLLALCGRLPSYHPLLVGDAAGRATADAADIDWMDWRDFLLAG